MAGIDDDEFPDLELDQDDQPTLEPGAKKGAHILLPQAMVEDAVNILGVAEIRTTKSICLVVQAPSADWVGPLHRYFKLLGNEWNFHHSRTVAPRSSAQQDEVTLEQTTRALAMGGRCLGVSHQLSLLPAAMLSAADKTLVLRHPNAWVVNAVIKAVTGRMPRGLDDQTVSVLDFGELAACIRIGSTAKACVDRLRAAAGKTVHHDKSITDAPRLEDLHGYGKARDWCLELVDDLEAWRRGETPVHCHLGQCCVGGPAGCR